MSSVVISGDVSGSVTLQAPSAAGTTVLTLPNGSGTVVTSTNISSYTTPARGGSSYITLTTGTTNVTLTAASDQCLIISANIEGCSVTLPDATTLPLGSTYFTFYNTSQFGVAIKDAGGTIREVLSPNSSNTYLKLQENANANGVWHIENPINVGIASAAAYTNIGTSTNISGNSLGQIIKVNATQYIATSYASGSAGAVYARLFTVNLSTKAVTWGNQVTLYTNPTSLTTDYGQIQGDSNGVDRGLILVGQFTQISASVSTRAFGFAVVSGTLYVSSASSAFTVGAAAAGMRVAGNVLYTGSNNAFFCFCFEWNNIFSANATGYTVGVSGTTVSITQASGTIAYATVAGNSWYCSPTSLTTYVVDTNSASNPRFVSYNTSTNAISGGTRTSQTTRIAGNLIATMGDTDGDSLVRVPRYFQGGGANQLILNSSNILMYLNGSPMTIANAGSATVTVVATTYTYKAFTSKNYVAASNVTSISDYYVNSASSYVVLDAFNTAASGNYNITNCDPTNSTYNFNVGKYANGYLQLPLTTSNTQALYFTSPSQIINFVYYTTNAANNTNIYMNLVNLATPFIS